MCTQKSPDNHADDLYIRYGGIYDDYLTSVVLPEIRSKHGDSLLDSFALKWKQHKLLVRHLTRMFVYLVV